MLSVTQESYLFVCIVLSILRQVHREGHGDTLHSQKCRYAYSFSYSSYLYFLLDSLYPRFTFIVRMRVKGAANQPPVAHMMKVAKRNLKQTPST